MAINPVSLSECLRPWHTAGISHFLCEHPLVTEAQAPVQNNAPVRSFEVPPPSKPAAPPVPGSASQPFEPQRAATPKSEIPCVELPSAWAELLSRTPRAPIVWTYPELGMDLTGQGDKHRSQCLRELIGSLGLPKGSSAFWPLRLSLKKDGGPDFSGGEEGGTHGNTTENTAAHDSPPQLGESAYFQHGISVIRPHAIIFFGIPCASLSGFELPLTASFSLAVRQGILFVALPELQSLIESPDIFTKTAAYLRTSLGGLPALYTR